MASGFVILAHPRSGSTLLADLLTKNGIATVREHLNPDLTPQGSSADIDRIVAAARRESGHTFGTKIMVHWLDGWRHLGEASSRKDTDVLRRYFCQDVSVVSLIRTDLTAAAISCSLAEVSGEWQRYPGDAPSELPRGLSWSTLRDHIRSNLDWLSACTRRITQITRVMGDSAILLSYEDLVTDRVRALERVTGLIAAAKPLNGFHLESDVARQSGNMTAAIRARFDADADPRKA